jgi:hypothetical protein
MRVALHDTPVQGTSRSVTRPQASGPNRLVLRLANATNAPRFGFIKRYGWELCAFAVNA